MQGFTLPGDTPEPLFARFHLAEFLTFFGAKKEAKKHPPPPRPPPIWGGCNLLRPETGLRKGFGIARKACALKGER